MVRGACVAALPRGRTCRTALLYIPSLGVCIAVPPGAEARDEDGSQAGAEGAGEVTVEADAAGGPETEYCVCRKGAGAFGGFMVQCEACEEWSGGGRVQ